MSRSSIQYRSAMERYVSLANPQEIADLIDDYLLARNYSLTEQSRELVRNVLVPFRLHPPMLRADLIAFLDTMVAPAR